jgi:hypothetical protein
MHRRTNPLGGPDRLPKFRPYGPIAAERSLKELVRSGKNEEPLYRFVVFVLIEIGFVLLKLVTPVEPSRCCGSIPSLAAAVKIGFLLTC